MRHAIRITPFALVGSLACTAAAPSPPSTLAPDQGRRVVARNGVVTSAHPLASEAGLAMLQQGGNAIDAAVAAAFAIGVVEPQMSGVGGGGALLAWFQGQRRAEFLDFYAAQPAATFRAARALGRDSTTPLRIVGVPGLTAGLLEAHARYGRLARERVLAPAIRIAEEGFPVYQVLGEFIARDSVRLTRDPVARALFFPGGRPLGGGEMLRNPDLAAVLRRIAEAGRAGFYEGEAARALVARMNAGGHPVTMADLAAYQPTWRRPLCTDYRGRVVLSAPPPEGGMQVLHTLELMERHDLAALGLPTTSARAFDVMTSAMRVGQLGARASDDPRWAAVPARGVVSADFAAGWSNAVGTGRAADSLRPRDARPFDQAVAAACNAFEPWTSAAPAVSSPREDDGSLGGETTHISVVDRDGNAVAVTVTNSSGFGAGVVVQGFLLNDSGFLFRAADFANDQAPAWRTRTTTIAPTILLRNGSPELVVGSPGGGRIPLAMAQVISYVVDYGLDPLEAIRMPRIYPAAANRRVELENGFPPEILAAARGMGYLPVPQGFGYARLYVIARRGDRWIGAADPRHDGQARGY
ncbi:MAG TPA: gamma-glutamyltransferase [Gemmatimonadaceae bacterium]|nr:gamma-glutamyltransferase [Gemmatimonadaceae bacterium]